jgi:hypothetical protein
MLPSHNIPMALAACISRWCGAGDVRIHDVLCMQVHNEAATARALPIFTVVERGSVTLSNSSFAKSNCGWKCARGRMHLHLLLCCLLAKQLLNPTFAPLTFSGKAASASLPQKIHIV